MAVMQMTLSSAILRGSSIPFRRNEYGCKLGGILMSDAVSPVLKRQVTIIQNDGLFASSPLTASFLSINTPTACKKRFLATRASASGADDSNVGKIVSEAASLPVNNTDSATSASTGKPLESEITETLKLGSLFALWYLFNIYFNIYNKQVLKVFPYPVTITTLQFAIGGIVVLLMWGTGIHKKPKLTKEQIISVLPLAVVHTLGNLFTNMSLGKVAVSFTHTIKAMEPFFSVLLSALVLGEQPALLVVLSLIPIVSGVALASISEASFNWAGFLSAMASNVTFQSRNVLSKKFMVKKDGSLDNINLFSVITLMSFFILSPIMFLVDNAKFSPTFLTGLGLDWKPIMVKTLLAGLCFHSYQQVSYMILQRVSPVTHSVGNCVKRVIVIVTSVFFFRTPVSTMNAAGTALALAGVFGYSRVKASKPKKS